ncbi:YlbF family regulator [Desulfosporosinus sp.]|uniref:YlbF family regulator n=1 Tax=Desulfosporosinus sp. TaxID=157907 RepID=UPI002321803C|nr:YlbF family regulator [Desulfosporosinus sp.]MCO5385876.1 YlbF family regulator [Desulfosporosinus sp.]MDA8221020.1 YlbF family regulator [Desulfitobacterium hafniense]
MNYIIKARELGEALSQTPEVQALKVAEASIMADPMSKEAFVQYQEKERGLVTTQMLSKIVPEKDTLALLDLKVRLMNKHPLIKAYFVQQQNYEKLMAMVNLTLTTAMHGMPSASDLPIPEEFKGMAQQILDKISGGNTMEKMQISPDMLKGIKLPPNL